MFLFSATTKSGTDHQRLHVHVAMVGQHSMHMVYSTYCVHGSGGDRSAVVLFVRGGLVPVAPLPSPPAHVGEAKVTPYTTHVLH